MTKKFGIDIDGTVTSPETFVPHLNKAFNLNLTLEDITEYDFSPFVNVSPAELGKWFKANERSIYETSPLADDAKAILQKWHQKHELFFISARHDKLLDVTEEWFQKNELSFHHIELVGSHFKVETAKRYDVDIFLKTNMIMLVKSVKNAISPLSYLILLIIAYLFQKEWFAYITG